MIGTGLALAAGGGMNGPQDLGGQMGFGPVAPEKDEPVFHADWEKRALGLTLCCRRDGRTGTSTRAGTRAKACIRPTIYASSYYEIWIKALEVLLKRHGFVTAADLAEGRALDDGQRRRSAC